MPAQGRAAVSREILHGEGFYPETSAGLFVGISTFQDNRFASIPYAVDDAVDLAWTFSLELGLIDARNCVLALIGQPEKEESRTRLDALLRAGAQLEAPELLDIRRVATKLSQEAGGQGLFVISAATHGLSEGGDDFLIANDSLFDDLRTSALAVAKLFDIASRSNAPRRLILLDACRERLDSARDVSPDLAMSRSFAEALAAATGLSVLSGSTVGGFSYDDGRSKNGVFSGALIAGLLGAAPADSRGYITLGTLAKFAHERVQSWVRANRPDHVGLSRGIEIRFEGSAHGMPLAINPAQEMASYERRRELALERVRENFGAIIDGGTYDRIKALLSVPGRPSPEAARLLAAVEALDGSEPFQRSLMHYLGTLKLDSPRPWKPVLAVVAALIVAIIVGFLLKEPDPVPLPQGIGPEPSEPTRDEDITLPRTVQNPTPKPPPDITRATYPLQAGQVSEKTSTGIKNLNISELCGSATKNGYICSDNISLPTRVVYDLRNNHVKLPPGTYKVKIQYSSRQEIRGVALMANDLHQILSFPSTGGAIAEYPRIVTLNFQGPQADLIVERGGEIPHLLSFTFIESSK